MAVATEQDRQFLAEAGFNIIGEAWVHWDGRQINSVLVAPTDSRRGTFMSGRFAVPSGRVVMWHAAKGFVDSAAYEVVRPVGSPCETPTACFIAAELCRWT